MVLLLRHPFAAANFTYNRVLHSSCRSWTVTTISTKLVSYQTIKCQRVVNIHVIQETNSIELSRTITETSYTSYCSSTRWEITDAQPSYHIIILYSTGWSAPDSDLWSAQVMANDRQIWHDWNCISCSRYIGPQGFTSIHETFVQVHLR